MKIQNHLPEIIQGPFLVCIQFSKSPSSMWLGESSVNMKRGDMKIQNHLPEIIQALFLVCIQFSKSPSSMWLEFHPTDPSHSL